MALRLRGVESLLQELLLEANDGCKHGFVLNLCGRDHHAAIQEVSQCIIQLFIVLSF